MEFVREKTLLHKLIVVDGIGLCGKSLLLDIISSFETVEKQEFNTFLEFIGMAHKYNKISNDIALAILKTEMDHEIYNNMIGRYINTRLSDESSVYRYHNPSKYLKRSLEKDGPIVYQRILEEKPIFLSWSHSLINKSDIIWEAFGNKLEWIYLNRNPIDLIYEWNKASYSERIGRDPTDRQYCIKYKNFPVPEAVYGWEEEFLSSTSLERAIKIVYEFFKSNLEGLQRKHDNQNIHIMNFEDLVTNPMKEIERIKKITKNDPLPVLDKMLVFGKCPRVLNHEEFNDREMNIRKNISHKYLDLLPEMDAMYQNIKNLAIKG